MMEEEQMEERRVLSSPPDNDSSQGREGSSSHARHPKGKDSLRCRPTRHEDDEAHVPAKYAQCVQPADGGARRRQAPKALIIVDTTQRHLPDTPPASYPSPVSSTMTIETRPASPEYNYDEGRRHQRFPSFDVVIREQRPVRDTLLASASYQHADFRVHKRGCSDASARTIDSAIHSPGSETDFARQLAMFRGHGMREQDSGVHVDIGQSEDEDEGEGEGGGEGSVASEDTMQDEWETQSVQTVISDDFPGQDADAVIDFALQTVYGGVLQDFSLPAEPSRQLVSRFLQELGQMVDRCSARMPVTNEAPVNSRSTPHVPIAPANEQGQQNRKGSKRKKRQSSDGEDNSNSNNNNNGSDDSSDRDDDEAAAMPAKKRKATQEEPVKLSCPFRKRNPLRFNVRDYHSCASTYFTTFADLRQHIIKKHRRNEAFPCMRCNKGFFNQQHLREHLNVPHDQMCQPQTPDPEDGIDNLAVNELIDRKKRQSSGDVEYQWREIWRIVFGEQDETKPHEFQAVIEHFDLVERYVENFPAMHASLRNMGVGDNLLSTMCQKFLDHFLSQVQSCDDDARQMKYSNRQGRRSDAAAATNNNNNRPGSLVRHLQQVRPRPDSGVVIDADSESGGEQPMASGSGAGAAHIAAACYVTPSTAAGTPQMSRPGSTVDNAMHQNQSQNQHQHQHQQWPGYYPPAGAQQRYQLTPQSAGPYGAMSHPAMMEGYADAGAGASAGAGTTAATQTLETYGLGGGELAEFGDMVNGHAFGFVSSPHMADSQVARAFEGYLPQFGVPQWQPAQGGEGTGLPRPTNL